VNAALQDQVGQNDLTTITATYTTGAGNATAVGTDSTNVVSAINNVVVTKLQALDATCAGTPGAFSTTAIQARPGQCVAYQISFTNNTGATVNHIYVSDLLNSYLVYCDGLAGTCAAGTTPAAGAWSNLGSSIATGLVTVTSNQVVSPTLGLVTSGQSAPIFQFEVKVK